MNRRIRSGRVRARLSFPAGPLLCLVLCLALALGLCACGMREESYTELSVCRVVDSGHGRELSMERLLLKNGDDPLTALTTAMEDVSGRVPGQRPYPMEVFVESVELERGIATVNMSGDYALLEGSELLLAEGAIVLSYGSLDQVIHVNIRCGGKLRSGVLTPEIYSLADGLCGGYERGVRLFLPDDEGTGLAARTVMVTDDGSMTAPRRVMTALLHELRGMEKAEIESVIVEDGVCSIDFSHEFYGAEPADSSDGMLMIYSIVNSLCRVPGVDAVHLSVEGCELESFGGYATRWPIYCDLSLLDY